MHLLFGNVGTVYQRDLALGQYGFDHRQCGDYRALNRRGRGGDKNQLTFAPANTYNVGVVAELLGAFEQAVLLAVFKLADEAYGRGILRGVQTALEREVAAGAVYATLDRLEQKGMISSRLESGTAARAGRARRYYRLTAVGAGALNESKAAMEKIWLGAKWPLESRA